MRMDEQKQRLCRVPVEAMCMLSECLKGASSRLVPAVRNPQRSAKVFAEYLQAQISSFEPAHTKCDNDESCASSFWERNTAFINDAQSLPENHLWYCLPDECLRSVMEHLCGEDLVILSGVSVRLRRLSKETGLWRLVCSRLEAFCEDPSIEVCTKRGRWTEWVRLYRALSSEAFAQAMTSQVLLPNSSGMESQGKVIRYSGEIGSDRAARAKEGWTLPPGLESEGSQKRLGLLARAHKFWGTVCHDTEWKVPPLLVSCDFGRRARYIHSRCRYFEVKILHCNDVGEAVPDVQDRSSALDRWCIAVGVSTQVFCLEGMQPGWDLNSCAYHGDDGRVFFGNSCVSSLPKFGPGDTVGCGLSHDGSLFFTKNGAFQGFVRDITQHLCNGRGGSRVLYPTVGVDSLCPIEINWGRKPFVYGFEELMQEHAAQRGLRINGKRILAGLQYDAFGEVPFDLRADSGQCTVS
mmetsp:Transcript_3264/g.6672  ORF Transcript_3264/g.6672 Transcript_3264/m.6672 type:complete len:465 (-) Transcript_3264:168-1562(-)|eukprot:CAMPEP_0181311798 /NCGR_PEP_ID=MMETSP1101-20121128/13345_1 /TAXON_ID=46948 /ORGANISM="Rhodomonas abbreviata, Strain Caron Lab Isolate" /LENGTH=464 /DNA_ID=CAMNT_0023418585 /DNA_START=277 /DNA_END=1671 /DNA_ORIENTATION=+